MTIYQFTLIVLIVAVLVFVAYAVHLALKDKSGKSELTESDRYEVADDIMRERDNEHVIF